MSLTSDVFLVCLKKIMMINFAIPTGVQLVPLWQEIISPSYFVRRHHLLFRILNSSPRIMPVSGLRTLRRTINKGRGIIELSDRKTVPTRIPPLMEQPAANSILFAGLIKNKFTQTLTINLKMAFCHWRKTCRPKE